MKLRDVFDKRCMKWFQTCFSVSISNLWISRAVIASMSMGSHWEEAQGIFLGWWKYSVSWFGCGLPES